MKQIPQFSRAEAAAFELPALDLAPTVAPAGGTLGVLLIHGFTSSPFEVRYLGERLSEHGVRVLAPVLRGHDSTPAELGRTTWQDWVAGVDEGFAHLAARCDRVAVIGQSLGGLLSLHLAARRGAEVAAVCSLAAPLWLHRLARAALWATDPTRPVRGRLGRYLGSFPKLSGSDVRDPYISQRNPGYRELPIAALHQLVAFMGVVERGLPAIEAPTLVIHSRGDHTAPYACSEHIAAKVGAETVRHCALDDSYHLIAVDVERARVAAEVIGFLRQVV
ncbi:MAG: alpha/beta fold hydrolase [Haliangiales bacterium]